MRALGENLDIDGLLTSIQTQYVDVSSIFEPGDEPKLCYGRRSRLIGLDCLETIRSGDTDFIPRKLFFRKCMGKFLRKMIEVFRETEPVIRRIVIGAPGVGKSILSFLCCLYQVARCKVNTLFMRKTKAGFEKISLFWMTPVDNAPDTVMIQFSRNITKRRKLGTVMEKALVDLYGRGFGDRNDFRCMVDGPRYESEDDLDDSDLVTSGGYPDLKEEEVDCVQRVILDSWLEGETVSCLKVLGLAQTKKAKEVHDICGGQIRRCVKVCEGPEGKIEAQKSRLSALLGNISPDTFDLITTSTTRSSDRSSVDTLRAMFASDDTLQYTRQVIQSTFVLRKLQGRMPLQKIRKNMLQARNAKPSSLYGIYFEAFGHLLMSTVASLPSLTPHIIDFSFQLAEGGWKESASMLDAPGVYWQPDSENFPNIDAAIVVSEVLHCIQYYAGGLGYHKFNITGFFEYFLQQLPETLFVSKVVVHFVTPEDGVCNGVAIPHSQKAKFEKQIVVEDDGLEIKWTKKNAGDVSSTVVESRAIAQDSGATEGLADDSGLTETDDMDISDSEYELDSSSDWSDGEISNAGLVTIQQFLPIYICRDVLNTNTDHTTEAPFEFLRVQQP